MKLNLSDWAVRNGALTLFLMLLLAVAGGFSYLKLGRAEDPGFTIKVMGVSAQWPGATADGSSAQAALPPARAGNSATRTDAARITAPRISC